MNRILKGCLIFCATAAVLATGLSIVGMRLAEQDALEAKKRHSERNERLHLLAKSQAHCLIDSLTFKGLRLVIIGESRLGPLVWEENEKRKEALGYPQCEAGASGNNLWRCYRNEPSAEDAYTISTYRDVDFGPSFPGLSEAQEKCGSLNHPDYEPWVEKAYWRYVREHPKYVEVLAILKHEEEFLTRTMRTQLEAQAAQRKMDDARASEPYLK